MQPKSSVPESVQRLSVLQAGVVSREQARGLGMSDHVLARLVREERWRRLAAGVFRTADVDSGWDALAWAGVLLGGEHARLGPASSAHLHGFVVEPPSPVDVLVRPNGSRLRSGDWRFLQDHPGVRGPSVGSPPRLSVDDAVLDLCATGTEGEVVALVTAAVQQRRTRPARLAAVLELRSRHPRRRLLQQLLGDVEAGAESSLEVSYLRDVERAHGLPVGSRQMSRAGLPFVTDVGYDGFRLLVELDGRLGHVGMGRFRDMDRDNQFVLAAMPTLRYGWFDVVDHPCLVAAQVAAVLRGQGWSDLLGRCRRCVAVPEADLWLSA